METRQYQENIIADILASQRPAVIASAPGAGKTEIAIRIVADLAKDPKNKILWVCWLQNQLLEQTYSAFAATVRPFSFGSFGPGAKWRAAGGLVDIPGENPNLQLTLSLPHSGKRLGSGYTHIIGDEGHQGITGKMWKEILGRNKKARIVALTGTPNPYLHPEPDKSPIPGAVVRGISIEEIIAENPNVYAVQQVELVQTDADLDDEDWDDKGTLRPAALDADTEATLPDVVECLVRRCKSVLRHPEAYAKGFLRSLDVGVTILEKLKMMTNEIQPTLWFCHDINQAVLIHRRLCEMGVKAALSDSKSDPKCDVFYKYVAKPEGVLVVVDRGGLGTNIPALMNVVDMSGTHNVDLLFQMLCRGIRVNRNDPKTKKLFIKVTPNRVAIKTRYCMSYVLAMATKETYLQHHGGVPRDRFPMPRKDKEAMDKACEEHKAARERGDVKMPDLPDMPTMFDLMHRDTGVAESYAYSSISKAIEAMGGWVEKWSTYEAVLEEAKRSNCSGLGEFSLRCSGAYRAVTREGWVERLRGDMMWPVPKRHTQESCRVSALQFKTRAEWQYGDGGAYRSAYNNDWLEICCKHMDGRRAHTLESCRESASQFRTRKEWQKGDPSAYSSAHKRGWSDGCCGHMSGAKYRTHTLESCKESASQFRTRREWEKGDGSAYGTALKAGWSDVCCMHMTTRYRTHTLESCKQSALKYKTRVEWQKGDTQAYQYARHRAWLAECCIHMTTRYRTHTLESCKESASQFKTRKEWHQGDRPSYRTAQERGWLEECCKHMGLPKKRGPKSKLLTPDSIENMAKS